MAEVRQPNSRDRIWLGSYETPEEAGRAYDAAVFCLRGPSAVLNFPWDPPCIPSAGELLPAQIQAAASRHARKVLSEPAGTVSSEMNRAGSFVGDSEEVAIGTSSLGGGEGVDTLIAGSAFYETPRVWSF